MTSLERERAARQACIALQRERIAGWEDDGDRAARELAELQAVPGFDDSSYEYRRAWFWRERCREFAARARVELAKLEADAK